MNRIVLLLLLAMTTLSSLSAPNNLAPVHEEARKAARQFLDSLAKDQSTLAQHAFADGARTEMSYFPGGRAGLPLKAMKPAQEELARTLLRSALSKTGLLKAQTIMSSTRCCLFVRQECSN